MTFRPANHRRPHQTGPDGRRDQRQGDSGEQAASPSSRCVAALVESVGCHTLAPHPATVQWSSSPEVTSELHHFSIQMFSLSDSVTPTCFLSKSLFPASVVQKL